MKPTEDQKFSTVIQNNTFYFFDPKFEEQYEGYLNSLKDILLLIKNEISTKGLSKDIFENLLLQKELGLRSLLALTGLSNETFKRLITIIRVVDDQELSKLVNKEMWIQNEESLNLNEWSDYKIHELIESNEYFRKGLINIFFEGSTIPFLTKMVPLFELKKLSISKLNFDAAEMIDTLIRYKEKGSYAGKKENNPEKIIEDILDNLGITHDKGDLNELVKNAQINKRTMDFIIPNKQNPLVIIESSYLVTTSSGQGDKSKTEISIDSLIKSNYPSAKFIGFIDGIGWYVRKGDLKRMVTAYEDVFTFSINELKRFEEFLKKIFMK